MYEDLHNTMYGPPSLRMTARLRTFLARYSGRFPGYSNMRWMPLIGLFLLVVQNIASVTIQHRVQSHRAEDTERFEPLTGIILVESLKFTISTLCILYGLSPSEPKETALTRLSTSHKDTALPALLYTIATILQSVGASYLDLVSYLVLSQLKIIMAPVFARAILNQRYPLRNWVYVAMMALGIILSQIGTAADDPTTKRLEARLFFRGVASMLGAGVCVALGSIHMEKTLKRPGVFFLANSQLAGYSFTFALFYLSWLTKLGFVRFFNGFDVLVVIYIALQVSGGFLVAWCVRMTSTVTKNYAQGLGFSLAITLPLVFSHHKISIQLAFGVILVLASVLGSSFSAQRKGAIMEVKDRHNSVELSNV